MEKTNAPLETCKEYVSSHKRHMKIANKKSHLKPYQKPMKCNLKQRDIFHTANGQKIKKYVSETVEKMSSHIHCSREAKF